MATPTSTDPLAGLDSVDWSKLSHAYGSADDVPQLLRKLQSADPKDYEDAIYELYGNIYHQGTRYSASIAAVPFLYGLLDTKATKDRLQIVQLLVHLALGDVFDKVPQGIDLEKWQKQVAEMKEPDYIDRQRQKLNEYIAGAQDDAERRRRQNLMDFDEDFETAIEHAKIDWDVYQAVQKGLSSIIHCLQDESPGVRLEAAFTLAFFPERSAEITEALSGIYDRETHCAVRSTAVLAIAVLHAASESSLKLPVIKKLRNYYQAVRVRNDVGDLVKWSCAAALVILNEREKGLVEEVSRVIEDEEYLKKLEASIGDEITFSFADSGLEELAEKILEEDEHEEEDDEEDEDEDEDKD